MQKNISKVPYFNRPSSRIEDMTEEQLQFYHSWLQKVKQGIYLEIEGNLGYIFIYLYSIVEIDSKDSV